MDERMLQALETHRAELRARWDALLHVEPATSPLGQPDALKHMIDYSLNTLFASLRTLHPGARKKHLRSIREAVSDKSLCPCGRNPLLAYFVAGEQALLESLILIQSTIPDTPENRTEAVLELKYAVAHVAHREIETFCALCQFKGHDVARREAHLQKASVGSTTQAPASAATPTTSSLPPPASH